MKAEQRKHLKENELAKDLSWFWRRVASGSTTNTIIWGVILLALGVAVGWRYWSAAAFRNRSAEWTAVEDANTPGQLEQVVKNQPGTVVARIAKFHLTRHQMNDALARVAGPSSEDRTKAADALVEVRNRYSELAKESPEPELIQESLMGVAKAEEILAGIPKADNPKEPRGSLETAEQAYRDLAKRYPDSYFGKRAAKRAEELDNHRTQIRGFYDGLMEAHAPAAAPPPLAPAVPGPAVPSGPILPEAPKAPAEPVAAPGGTSPSATPTTGTPPNPPSNTPSGINPAEAPNQPKPKGP